MNILLKAAIFCLSLLGLITLLLLLVPPVPKETLPGTETLGSPTGQDDSAPKRKRILIFSSRGGGGHTSVSEAIKSYLPPDEYSVAIVNIFTDVLGSLDPAQTLTGQRRSGENVYDFTLQKKWNRMTMAMFHLGSWYFNFRQQTVVNLLGSFLEKHKPDMVISVIPIVNSYILEAARQHDLPFLLLPTDFNPTTFLQGIEDPAYDKFKLALAFKDQSINELVEPAEVPTEQISYVGFPIRRSFLRARNASAEQIQTVKKSWDIPEGKPVALLMMGSVGSKDLIAFTQKLGELEEPIHLLVAVGRSAHLADAIEEIPLPEHVTVKAIPFTTRVAELMLVSDLIITKSGTVSFAEGLYLQRPMLLDNTSTPLMWEKLNHDITEARQIGMSIDSITELPELVSSLLTGPKAQTFRQNLKAMDLKDPSIEVPLLIKQMLEASRT